MSKMNNHTIAFVLGLFDTGYTVAHMLLETGIPVIGFTENPKYEIGSHTSCFKVEVIPTPKGYNDKLLSYFLDYIKNLKMSGKLSIDHKPILFPCSDAFVYWIADNEEILKDHFLFEQPSLEIMKRFRDKSLQDSLAIEAGLSVPKTFEVSRTKDVDSIINKINLDCQFPLFIKAAYVEEWTPNYDVKGFKVDSVEQLKKCLQEVLFTQSKVIVQEIIQGPENNLYEFSALVLNKEIVSFIITNKIHQYPLDFGVGSLMRIASNPQIEALAKCFINKSGITGILNIEFKIDERDNKPRYIETNLRCWQQISLTKLI